MFSKKSLPVLLAVVIGGILIAFTTLGNGNPPTKYEKIFQQVAEMLEEAHYSPHKIDDSFSKEIFKNYREHGSGQEYFPTVRHQRTEEI